MSLELTDKSRDALLRALETILDTRDKRFMFLKIEFPKVLSFINLEGSSHVVSFGIYDEFRKRGMLGSLMATLNSKLDTDLYLELK